MHICQLDLPYASTLQRLRALVDLEGTLGRPAERQRALTIPFIETQLSSPFQTVGAYIDENLIGSASVSPMPICPLDQDTFIWFALSAVIVHPDFRRGGIGRALVLECLSRAKQHGADAVLLDVNIPNPAMDLYKSIGFEEWSVCEGAYRHDGQRIDQVSMRKWLRPRGAIDQVFTPI